MLADRLWLWLFSSSLVAGLVLAGRQFLSGRREREVHHALAVAIAHVCTARGRQLHPAHGDVHLLLEGWQRHRWVQPDGTMYHFLITKRKATWWLRIVPGGRGLYDEAVAKLISHLNERPTSLE